MDDDNTSKLPPNVRQRGQPFHEPAPIPAQTPAPYHDQPAIPITERPVRKKKKRKSNPSLIALGIFTGLILLSCGGLSLAYYFYNTVQKPLNTFIRPVSRSAEEPTFASSPTYNIIQGKTWNILLLGSDNDGKYAFPDLLTQVMMIVRIDTVNNTVNMVSIPRDSWVSIPNTGSMHKIDQAFLLGANRKNSFEDGVRLARLTVEKDYGVMIDRYAWVGLDGFAKVINTLGGVDVTITRPIVDDTYPNDTGTSSDPNNPNAYKRLYLAPGPQHLNGDQALEYVRSRHADLVGDIGRTQRQQQVLEALKLKLNVASIVANLPQFLKDLTGQLYTDLSEPEMAAFANFGRTLQGNTLQHLTLGPGQGDQNYGRYANIYDPSLGTNQDVVIPDCSTIQPAINRIFELSNEQSCNIAGP